MIETIKSKWGYSTLAVDRIFTIYICKIAVVTDAIPDILGVETTEMVVKTKKGKKSKRLVLHYCTMNFFEYERMQKEITKFLEEIALQKVYKKYAWRHKETVPTPEASTEEAEYLPKDWEMLL
jgi:hypothetical protein